MKETLLEELKRYLDWSSADEVALRQFLPHARGEFQNIVDAFYDRILAHEAARRVLDAGGHEVHRLQKTLAVWLERMLLGPWDENYFQLRCNIGRAHVRISLPQHYMFVSMNVVRSRLLDIADRSAETATTQTRAAINKALDLELAIMLHAYREDLLAQQARSERLATFGQMAGSIGHELRNPLGVMETSLYLLNSRLPDDERVHKHVGRIGEQLRLANGIITNMLDIIRDRPMTRERVVLKDVVSSVLASSRVGGGTPVELVGLADQFVEGDALALRQILINLVQNAQQAAGQQGSVTVTFTNEERAGRPFVVVAVEDDGPGLDPSMRRRLFEPLMTTKRTGIGLGLALVKRLVERHSGVIEYEPREGGGARFVVKLPVEAK